MEPQTGRLAAIRQLDALQNDLLRRIDDLDKRVASTLEELVSHRKMDSPAVADPAPNG
ncbi:MAG: hypothetical protein NTW96_11915 [Planctomycetia bacterium]|nr:hypothetical protein [Planctomycetia bacterium]